MNWEAFAREALQGSLHNVAMMAGIIFSIMMVIEIGRDLHLLDRLTSFLEPSLRLFGLSRQAAFPLLVGLIFGIAYGAGVIIEAAKTKEISFRDLLLVNIFLSACHALIEDTALFIAVGADPWIILGGRVLLGVVLLFLAGRLVWPDARLRRSGAADEKSCLE